jgi:hypothetical protein
MLFPIYLASCQCNCVKKIIRDGIVEGGEEPFMIFMTMPQLKAVGEMTISRAFSGAA